MKRSLRDALSLIFDRTAIGWVILAALVLIQLAQHPY
jgi:hypothetical protein